VALEFEVEGVEAAQLDELVFFGHAA